MTEEPSSANLIPTDGQPSWSSYFTWAAVLYVLAAPLFFANLPGALRWPGRALFVFALGWLVRAAYTWVRRTKFEKKKVIFSLILGLFCYGALYLMCHVFIRLMSEKDERLLTVDATQLSQAARLGIKAMLAGDSPVQYDRDIGWVHRPGYKWGGHSITEQGLRGTLLYPETPADPAKRLLCVGDSFTFGYEVGDDECYPAFGEKLLPGTEWINLGLCGGGLTQALLQYRKAGRKFGGKYVIIGFMTNNQKRTVNCFRAFVAPGGAMTPLTQPYARVTGGKVTIEPNPFQDISDYTRLLENEEAELTRLRELDYVTWSDQHGSSNPVLRTLHYLVEQRGVDRHVAALLYREWDRLPPLNHGVDPYGASIWHPESLAFKANAGVFDLFYEEVVADGRVPLIVIIPSAQDVEERAKKGKSAHATLMAHLKDKGYRHFDFLDSLERRYPDELSKERFFLSTHLNAQTNKFLTEEIINALDLQAASVAKPPLPTADLK